MEYAFGFLGLAVLCLAMLVVKQRGRAAAVSNELAPFRERLQAFETLVRETYEREGRERFHLEKEIDALATETRLLSQSLRGDNKAQGDWGEVLLQTILESSGLREGEEFQMQATIGSASIDAAAADSDGLLRPDAIVNLPGGRQLVVDAKVSLTAWDRYCREEDEDVRLDHLTDHVLSLRRHIQVLSKKNYASKVDGISPEFVFLFTRLEPAWIEAMRAAPELMDEGWRKGVVVVSPTTLFAALKTVAGLWLRERQNENAMAIADEAGKLYDKFVAFQADLIDVEQHLSLAAAKAREARRKLHEGPGNIVGRAEKLRTLGAKTTRRLTDVSGDEGPTA